MKIAIYGGSFNPVHNEHVNIAAAAVKELGLGKIIIVPSNISPHKSGCMVAPPAQRLDMCRAAFSGIGGAEISACEIERGGVSYSYQTCIFFKNLYPRDELYFVMGADMLESFSNWREPQTILGCVTPAACAREDPARLLSAAERFSKCFGKDAVTFGYVGKKVSSTAVRTLAALGESVALYVPPPVENLMRSRNLYLIEEVKGVKSLLTPERWKHTVNVAVTAAENARRFGVGERDAVVAAALHDCAKYLGEDSPLLRGFKLPSDVPPPVAHQFAGAFVAEKVFGIKDESILNAVRYHTSGRENMSGIEKLIYLSDLLEEDRKFSGVNDLRKIFAEDPDGCLLSALGRQIEYLKSQNKPVYPLTLRAYEYLKKI